MSNERLGTPNEVLAAYQGKHSFRLSEHVAICRVPESFLIVAIREASPITDTVWFVGFVTFNGLVEVCAVVTILRRALRRRVVQSYHGSVRCDPF